jgi:hypothetical protein
LHSRKHTHFYIKMETYTREMAIEALRLHAVDRKTLSNNLVEVFECDKRFGDYRSTSPSFIKGSKRPINYVRGVKHTIYGNTFMAFDSFPNNQHICAAGGTVMELVRGIRKRKRYGSDIDFFLFGFPIHNDIRYFQTNPSADKEVKRFLKHMDAKYINETQNCITFRSKGITCQIIKRIYRKKHHIIIGFDIDPSRFMYFRGKYYTTRSGFQFLRTNTFPTDTSCVSKNWEYRVDKYVYKKGCNLYMVGVKNAKMTFMFYYNMSHFKRKVANHFGETRPHQYKVRLVGDSLKESDYYSNYRMCEKQTVSDIGLVPINAYCIALGFFNIALIPRDQDLNYDIGRSKETNEMFEWFLQKKGTDRYKLSYHLSAHFYVTAKTYIPLAGIDPADENGTLLGWQLREPVVNIGYYLKLVKRPRTYLCKNQFSQFTASFHPVEPDLQKLYGFIYSKGIIRAYNAIKKKSYFAELEKLTVDELHIVLNMCRPLETDETKNLNIYFQMKLKGIQSPICFNNYEHFRLELRPVHYFRPFYTRSNGKLKIRLPRSLINVIMKMI